MEIEIKITFASKGKKTTTETTMPMAKLAASKTTLGQLFKRGHYRIHQQSAETELAECKNGWREMHRETVLELTESHKLLESALKWVRRIEERSKQLPTTFLDNCNPKPLRKAIEAHLAKSA